MRKHEHKTVVDILILVALKDELDALLAIDAPFVESEWIQYGGTNSTPYWHRKFSDANGVAFSVAAARTTEMRGEAVAALGGKLVTKLKPKAIAMCGVCAGPRDDVHQGDVIVATELFRYDMGKIVTRITSEGTTEEELFHEIRTYNLKKSWKYAVQDSEGCPSWHEDIGIERPISFPLQEHWMREALSEYMNGGDNPQERDDGHRKCPDWTMVLTRLRDRKEVLKRKLKLTRKGLNKLQQDCQSSRDGPEPDDPMKIQVGPMATVTNVVQDLDENGRARIFNAIRKYQRKTLAIEMEATAVGCVAELDEIPCIVAKGVQDYADQDKDDRYRKYAARASARFLIEFFHQHLNLVKGTADPLTPNLPATPSSSRSSKSPLVGPPIAHPVQTLDDLDYKTLPLDIGTIWGLERGSFIGVVIGNTANQLRETLLRSERALEDALKRSTSTIKLPKRYWFKVNATLYPSGPNNENELWSACICEDADLIKNMRMAVAQGELLGFIVELSDAEGYPELLASHWVKILFSDRFPLKQYSIIFCVSSDDNFKKQLIKELKSVTSDLPVAIPVEALQAIKQNQELSNIREQRQMLFEQHEDLSSIGLGIATWIQSLMVKEKTDRGELERRFSQLWEWLIQVDTSVRQEVANQESVNIETACQDLMKVFQNEATYDVGRQFLTLCIQRDRSRAGMLLKAAASSPSYRLRREALVASITDDDLVNFWLRGAIYIEEDISRPDFLIADPASLVDALALATMRLLNGTDPDNKRLHELLDSLQSKIGIDVKQVYDLCMERFDEENFWENCNGQSQLFAVRAGCRLRPSIRTLTREGLQHLPPWWFLMTKEPDSIWLASYLELRPELRWPLGLVNREERDTLNIKQRLLVEDVVACRRGRLCAL